MAGQREARAEAMKRFSNWLWNLMATRGMTQADISKASGVSPSMLSKYLNQQALPNPSSAIKVARSFGIKDAVVLEIIAPRVEAPVMSDTSIDPDLIAFVREFSRLPKQAQKHLLAMLDGVYSVYGLRPSFNRLMDAFNTEISALREENRRLRGEDEPGDREPEDEGVADVVEGAFPETEFEWYGRGYDIEGRQRKRMRQNPR